MSLLAELSPSPLHIDAPPAADVCAPKPSSKPLPQRILRATLSLPRIAWQRFSWQRFPSTWTLWPLLLLITGLGAFLRFWRLGYQSYWTDEGRTLHRISGTFDQMVGLLKDQGFPPGWYASMRAWVNFWEWKTGSSVLAYSPEITRIFPALLGTLTVPALYFLGRQFTDRKGALLVALLAAVNPFLIYYSRDIKMYAAIWFFMALHVAIFLKWQTTHRHWLWLPLFSLTGAAMLAMHATAFFIVGLELVFLLTRPRVKSLDAPLWLARVFPMVLLPIWWYVHKSVWVSRAVDDGVADGLFWITQYTDMSWKTIVSLPCSHLLGYLWPEYPPTPKINGWFDLGPDFDQHLATRSWPWLANAELYVALAVGAVMVLGLLPWRGWRKSPERQQSVTAGRWWWVALWIVVPSTFLALTWLPADSWWSDALWRDLLHLKKKPNPIWEPRYLGIVVPAFILWLAAAMRRLPTWPLRTLVILAVLAISTVSSLSNHLIYRQSPWQRTAKYVAAYGDPKARNTVAVGLPATAHPGNSDIYTVDLAGGRKPVDINNPWREPVVPYYLFNRSLHDGAYRYFLGVKSSPSVKTIVLTDRLGDIQDGPLSDEALAGFLGPQWRLVSEETYRWHYEWRYYIFHTWRTRVWVRDR